MKAYRIYSRAGLDMGAWQGCTARHALVRMFRDAGYAVRYFFGKDKILWPDRDTLNLCGDETCWIITQE